MSNLLPISVTRMTFDDEFNTFSNSPDGSSGTWMTSYPYGGEAARTLTGNNEAEYYSDSSVGVNPFSNTNGVLTISATPAPAGSNPYNLPYDSGLITTYGSFSQTYGYFEVNAKLPAEQGLWPAFWLLPANNVYSSELDVFEQVSSNATQIASTVHGSTNGAWSSNSQGLVVPNTSTGFNTFGVDWEPTTTTYYVDGVEIGSAPTPASMNNPMYLLLNLAVGGAGSWPGQPDSTTTFPANMQIDWVRAYATANTTYVGGRSAIAAGSAASVVPASAITATAAQTQQLAPVTTGAVTLGSGPDTLTLQISEDYYQGNAQFVVGVDGTQIGGIQTATAIHGSASQTFNILGSFGPGAHTAEVSFLNDQWGGSAQADRNLYVDSATIDGQAITGAAMEVGNSGLQEFTFNGAVQPAAIPSSGPAGPAAPATVVIGTGPDTLALQIAEDAWQGDAQYTVSINGVQMGGVQTATALQSSGVSQTVDIKGTLAAGAYTVSVNFLNDAWGGTATMDRNLYVDGATVNGVTVPGATLALFNQGAQSFGFTDGAGPVLTAGSGADTLALTVSEDAWGGNAQFTVSVDGQQVGGTLTATSLQGLGQQTVDVMGNFSAGQHTVAVDLLNPSTGSGTAPQRTLYVDSAAINGSTIAGGPLTLATATAQGFSFVKQPVTPQPVTIGAGSDSFTVGLSEDAWQGDAQYTVSVNGTQVGGVQTATASHTLGQTQTVTVDGNWGNTKPTIGISFINDAWGGTATTDRNLYVNSVSYDGTAITPGSAALMSNGTAKFTAPASAPPQGTVTLQLAEDASNGNAQYSAAIDGKTVVQNAAVTALNSQNQVQSVNIPGTLAVGWHLLDVSFLNASWNGSTANSRDLYLKGVEVNGTTVGGSARLMESDNTQVISIYVPKS